jgi:hypothetical protein
MNIASPLPPRGEARRFHSSISAAIATMILPPDFVPIFVAAAATAAVSATGVRSVGTISVRRHGVNWKMGKLTRDQAVARSGQTGVR